LSTWRPTWTRYYAGWADKLDGLALDNGRDGDFAAIAEPFGVVGIIITWNAPLLSLVMKIPPALAAGNTVVLKPAEFTPFTSMRFLELAREAGLPDGVLNLIIGGPRRGRPFRRIPGSTRSALPAAGHGHQDRQSAANNLVPVLFELGGKGANLVFDDANLAEAIPYSAMFALMNTGQGCALPTRLLAQRGVYDAVVEGVTAVVSQLVTGDPLEPTTFSGPLVNDAALQRVSGIIEKAKAEKAGRIVLGGERPGGELTDGFFIDTTIFADVDPHSSLAQNEVFGPVLSIIPFDTEEQAVEIANGTAYGLSNYVQTGDMRRALRLARDLHSGTVGINGTGNMHVGAPFGGVGISRLRPRRGPRGILEFVSTKTVLIGNKGVFGSRCGRRRRDRLEGWSGRRGFRNRITARMDSPDFMRSKPVLISSSGSRCVISGSIASWPVRYHSKSSGVSVRRVAVPHERAVHRPPK